MDSCRTSSPFGREGQKWVPHDPQLEFFDRCSRSANKVDLFSLSHRPVFFPWCYPRQKHCCRGNGGAPFQQPEQVQQSFLLPDGFGFCSSQALPQAGWMNLGSIKDLIYIILPRPATNFWSKGLTLMGFFDF